MLQDSNRPSLPRVEISRRSRSTIRGHWIWLVAIVVVVAVCAGVHYANCAQCEASAESACAETGVASVSCTETLCGVWESDCSWTCKPKPKPETEVADQLADGSMIVEPRGD